MLTKLLCEFGATALMIIFGVGVHCDTVLKGTKYQGSGHMFAITTWSFGISVALFIFGGAVCMNPAMVLAQCIVGLVPWSSCIPFMIADMLGGFAGAVIAWLMYADEFKASDGVVDPIAQRNIFSTNPTTEGTNYARNFFCEAICTFVFISAILAAASRAGENVLMLAICVGLIVWAVGMGMGGITGFAMNQARDLGPRMAYQVLSMSDKDAAALADAIRGAHTRLHRCRICQNYTDADLCPVCASAKRDTSVICVVEKPRDVQAFERTREYNGLYHVLHGLLDPLAGVGAEQLTVKELLARLKDDTVKEVIMAMNPTVEGEATAMYLAKLIKPLGIRVTRLASGLPVGASLEYADETTLYRALSGRGEL